MCACSWCCCSCCGYIQLLLLLSPHTAARGCSIHTALSAGHFLPEPSQPTQSRDHCLQAQHDTAQHTKAWHNVANILIQLCLSSGPSTQPASAKLRSLPAGSRTQHGTHHSTPSLQNHEHDPCEYALTTWDTRWLLFRFSKGVTAARAARFLGTRGSVATTCSTGCAHRLNLFCRRSFMLVVKPACHARLHAPGRCRPAL